MGKLPDPVRGRGPSGFIPGIPGPGIPGPGMPGRVMPPDWGIPGVGLVPKAPAGRPTTTSPLSPPELPPKGIIGGRRPNLGMPGGALSIAGGFESVRPGGIAPPKFGIEGLLGSLGTFIPIGGFVPMGGLVLMVGREGLLVSGGRIGPGIGEGAGLAGVGEADGGCPNPDGPPIGKGPGRGPPSGAGVGFEGAEGPPGVGPKPPNLGLGCSG